MKDTASWGIALARLAKEGSQFVQQHLEPLGLGTGLHPYLLALELRPLIQEVLSARLLVDKASTTRALAKLEAAGLVGRSVTTEDRRAKLVALTDAGRALLPAIHGVLAQWDSELHSRLEESKVTVFNELLMQVVGDNSSGGPNT